MSYSDTLETPLDRVRALLGDTSNVAATELLTDDHIGAALVLYSFNMAVAFMASGLAARFAQDPSSVSLPSGLSVSWSERVKYWSALAEQMRAGGVTSSAAFARTPIRTDGYRDAALL